QARGLRSAGARRRAYARPGVLDASATLALGTHGLACAVDAVVEEARPDSPAAKAGLQDEDVIKAVQLYEPGDDGKPQPAKWTDLGIDQWPNAHYLAQRIDSHQLGLRVQRKQDPSFEVLLTGEPDESWPMADRGLVFATDTR